MENKTTRFLKISLILVSLIYILIFYMQTFCMNFMSADAIRQLGVIYMSGMSEQVASHFGTIIELRLSQVEALVDAVPPGRFKDGMPLQIELTYNARSAGFEYLAFYTNDGKFHMIYGPEMEADLPEALRRSVQGGKYNVCAGKDETGMPLVLMGVPAEYPMEDGGTSIGLVAGLPTSYLSDALAGSVNGSMVEYAIIRDDGSYILQSQATEEESYFDRIERLYKPFRGQAPGQYARELREALEYDRNYTSEVQISNERWNVYCTRLPNSEWHLLLNMSHNTLDETVDHLRRRWFTISIGGCSLILGVLLFVFAGYFRLTKKQMYALDEARKSAERSNRAKSEFLSNISHDIRTPMNGIMGMTSIAIESLDNPPRVRTCLKKINVSSRHLLGLINDMLDMSKIESGRLTLRMEPVCLREIMQNIITVIMPQIHEKDQQLHIRVYNIYHENVCSDRVRLSQILLNILGNAVKFTAEGGKIEVDLREEPSPKGEKYIRSCLHIGDNGIGMSEEFQGRIFDAFAREDNARVDRTAGAGMGMTITKHIVDAMGGTIVVKSEQGKGSDFYVIIDMEKSVQQEQEFSLPEQKVLVIDDDDSAAKTAEAALRSIGLRAECAPGLAQASRMIEESRQKGEDYHILLMDWDIEGKDGIQEARALRSGLGVKAPILLLSDGENDELELKAEEGGMNGLIVKPLFRSSLYYGLRSFAEVETQKKEEEEEVDLTGRHILVAEDNEMNWEIVEAMLSEFGAELEWAENGQICVEKFKQSEPGWYAAILMDLRMPVMTGFEATTAIRALDREDAGRIPIIAISADAFADDVKKCFDCGMTAHTSKPFDLDQVVRLLDRHLR